VRGCAYIASDANHDDPRKLPGWAMSMWVRILVSIDVWVRQSAWLGVSSRQAFYCACCASCTVQWTKHMRHGLGLRRWGHWPRSADPAALSDLFGVPLRASEAAACTRGPEVSRAAAYTCTETRIISTT